LIYGTAGALSARNVLNIKNHQLGFKNMIKHFSF
jgi:hypothetical protein